MADAAAVGGVGWWLLGFPPGWGWIVAPMIPSMPVNLGALVVLATVAAGAYGASSGFGTTSDAHLAQLVRG